MKSYYKFWSKKSYYKLGGEILGKVIQPLLVRFHKIDKKVSLYPQRPFKINLIL